MKSIVFSFFPALLISIALVVVDYYFEPSRWTLLIAATFGTAATYILLPSRNDSGKPKMKS